MLTTTSVLVVSAASVTALLVLAAAFAWGFRGWLDLKRAELGLRAGPSNAPPPQVGSRIELADLRERVRKLEAIAAGVDL